MKGAITPVASSLGEDCEDRWHVLLVPLPRSSGSTRPARPERPWPGRQGHRADGPSPRARDSAPSARPAEASARRSRPARRCRLLPAAVIVPVASGHAADASARAPVARTPEVAAARREAGSAATFTGDPRACSPARAREPTLGASADLRRVGQAWPAGVADEHPPSACPCPVGSRAATGGAELARVPRSPGRQHRGVRLLHG